MSTFWPCEPPGSGNDLSWAGPGRPVLDPLVDHSHRCPGRHAVADLTCPPAVGGKSHTLLHMCSLEFAICNYKKISAPPSFSYLTSAAISLCWSSYFSPLSFIFFPIKVLFSHIHFLLLVLMLSFPFFNCLSFLFSTLSSISSFPSPAPLSVICCPVWLLQTPWAAPPLWDGVLPRPLGGPALGGGEAGVRTIIPWIFLSGLLSPPPLPPGGKKTSPAVSPRLPHLGGWWCSLAYEVLAHFLLSPAVKAARWGPVDPSLNVMMLLICWYFLIAGQWQYSSSSK